MILYLYCMTFFEHKILPAVTFPVIEEAIPVTEALARGGLPVLEVAFRTPVAASSIKMIRKVFPEVTIGAGTILTIEQLHKAIDAGAQFGLSPGLNARIVKEARRLRFPFIPGVMTPSDIELAVELGCTVLKLFPAAQIGGVDFLKAMDGPYGHLELQYIPMGGVNLLNMNDYLELKQVVAIGGSWLASASLITRKDYAAIEQNAREAVNKAYSK